MGINMTLNENQAFQAMVLFLEEYYKRGKSDDIAMLLSSLILLEDGSTADPAMWGDWLQSIRKLEL